MQPPGIEFARHAIRVRVYYEDTDAGGVVYYANYLRFFERCRTELLRTRGVDQGALLRGGIGFVVRRASVEYLASARLDDELIVTAGVERLGAASAWFAQEARLGDVTLASARVQVACVDPRTGRPRPMPDPMLDALRAPPIETFAVQPPRFNPKTLPSNNQ